MAEIIVFAMVVLGAWDFGRRYLVHLEKARSSQDSIKVIHGMLEAHNIRLQDLEKRTGELELYRNLQS